MQTGWKQIETAGTAMTATEHRWLTYSGSLTKRLRQMSVDIEHHIRQETWGVPKLEESQRLGLSATQPTRIRETHWCDRGTLWVTTRAIIPTETMQGKGERLRRLGDLSLGDFLFADPSLQRSAFEFAQVMMEKKNCWARRSVFLYFDRPLLVNEIFLPSIFNIDPPSDD